MPLRFGRLLKSKWFLLLCLAIFIFLALAFFQEFSRRYYLEQQIEKLESERTSLVSQNQEFSELLKYLETENFTEEEARLKLGLKKPGEEVLVINQPSPFVAAGSSAPGAAQLSNPAKWWYYFFHQSVN